MILKYLGNDTSWVFIEGEIISVAKVDMTKMFAAEIKEWMTDYEQPNPDRYTEITAKVYDQFISSINCVKDRLIFNLNNENVTEKDMYPNDRHRILPEGFSPFVGVETPIVVLIGNSGDTYLDRKAVILSQEYSTAFLLNNNGQTVERIV